METCDSARHDLMTIQTALKLLSVYQPRAIVCIQWNIWFVSSLLHVVCRLVHFQFGFFGVWEFSLVFIVSYVIHFLDSWWSIQSENNQSLFRWPQNEDTGLLGPCGRWLWRYRRLTMKILLSMRRIGQRKNTRLIIEFLMIQENPSSLFIDKNVTQYLSQWMY